MIIEIKNTKDYKAIKEFIDNNNIKIKEYDDTYHGVYSKECEYIYDNLLRETKGELRKYLLNSDKEDIIDEIAKQLNKCEILYDLDTIVMMSKNMILYQYMEELARDYNLHSINIYLSEDLTNLSLSRAKLEDIAKVRKLVKASELNEQAIDTIRKVITLCMVSNYKAISDGKFKVQEMVGYRDGDYYNFYITKFKSQ